LNEQEDEDDKPPSDSKRGTYQPKIRRMNSKSQNQAKITRKVKEAIFLH